MNEHTHTHTFNGPLSRTTQVSRYQKGKTIWILLKQEAVSGSGISWAVCKSAPHSRQITTPAPHHLVFLQVGCPSCRPTNSVKALKGQQYMYMKITQNKLSLCTKNTRTSNYKTITKTYLRLSLKCCLNNSFSFVTCSIRYIVRNFILHWFLPRDAMLERYMLQPCVHLCLFCHKSVFY